MTERYILSPTEEYTGLLRWLTSPVPNGSPILQQEIRQINADFNYWVDVPVCNDELEE